MPLVPMRLLLDHAAEHNYGLAAFNVNDMEQIQAILEAAAATDSPVIVQASPARDPIRRTITCGISCSRLPNCIRGFQSPCTRTTAIAWLPARAHR